MVQSPGFFVVLDGTDGSGKTLQTKLLSERMEKEGHRIKVIDFPQYNQWSAQFVERYLRGEFGSVNQVSAKQASLFYALDRYAASFNIRQWLENGFIVISNRYVSSNKGHQLGKIAENKEMKQFLDWINELEYDILSIPKPHLTLFLHMKPEIGQGLVDKKSAREYLQGKKRDIHEADIDHLRNAERAFVFCLNNDHVENWKIVTCFQDDNPRSVQEIHQEIHRIITENFAKFLS